MLGARNIRMSPDGDALYFDSSLIFGYETGCSQLYSLPVSARSRALVPRRVSTGYGNAEHVAFVPPHNNRSPSMFLYASSFPSDEATQADIEQARVCKQRRENNYNALYKQYCHWPWIRTNENPCKWLTEETDYWRNEVLEVLDADNDIYLANASSNAAAKRLTVEPGFDGFPVVSSDASTVFYTSMRSGNAELWRMSAVDGTNKTQLTASPGFKLRPAESPDQRLLIFECYLAKSDYQEFLVALNRNNHYNRTASRICSMALSPDGRVDDADNGTRLREIHFRYSVASAATADRAATELYQLTNPVFVPNTDGRRIVFSARDARVRGRPNTALYMSDVDGSGLEQIVDVRANNNDPAFDWSGKRIAWRSSVRPTLGVNNLYMADWEPKQAQKPKSCSNAANSTTFRLTRIVQLTNLTTKDGGALHAQFSPSGASILYEWRRGLSKLENKGNVNSSAIAPLYDEYVGEHESEIWRMYPVCAKTPAKTCPEGSSVRWWEEDGCCALHQQRVSSVLESAAHGLATFAGGERFLVYALHLRPRRHEAGHNPQQRCVQLLQQQRRDPLGSVKVLWEGADIHKANALGQLLRPLVQSDGFDGEPSIHVSNRTTCQMVFTSTAFDVHNDASSNAGGDAADADLWIGNVCGEQWSPPLGTDESTFIPRVFKRLLRRRGYEGEAQFSPDGTRVVFTATVDDGQLTDGALLNECRLVNTSHTALFLINVDGTGLRQLTHFGTGHTFAPQFLPPDGQHIVFSSDFEQQQETGGDNNHSASSPSASSSLYVIHQSGKWLRRVHLDQSINGRRHSFHRVSIRPAGTSAATDDKLLVVGSAILNVESTEVASSNVFVATLEVRRQCEEDGRMTNK